MPYDRQGSFPPRERSLEPSMATYERMNNPRRPYACILCKPSPRGFTSEEIRAEHEKLCHKFEASRIVQCRTAWCRMRYLFGDPHVCIRRADLPPLADDEDTESEGDLSDDEEEAIAEDGEAASADEESESAEEDVDWADFEAEESDHSETDEQAEETADNVVVEATIEEADASEISASKEAVACEKSASEEADASEKSASEEVDASDEALP